METVLVVASFELLVVLSKVALEVSDASMLIAVVSTNVGLVLAGAVLVSELNAAFIEERLTTLEMLLLVDSAFVCSSGELLLVDVIIDGIFDAIGTVLVLVAPMIEVWISFTGMEVLKFGYSVIVLEPSLLLAVELAVFVLAISEFAFVASIIFDEMVEMLVHGAVALLVDALVILLFSSPVEIIPVCVPTVGVSAFVLIVSPTTVYMLVLGIIVLVSDIGTVTLVVGLVEVVGDISERSTVLVEITSFVNVSPNVVIPLVT